MPDERDDAPETIAAAMQDVTDESIGVSEDDDDSEDTGTVAATAEGEAGAADVDATGEPEAEGEQAAAGASDDDADSVFENMTPEQLAAIKASPELTGVYRSLMGATRAKFARANDALRLLGAYTQDSDRFIRALAQANGYTVTKAGTQPREFERSQAEADTSGKELEELFGEKFGPKVREVFENWFNVRTGTVVGPLRDALGQMTAQSEAARFMSEEQSFLNRHRKIMTPEICREVTALGESKKIGVGAGQTPAEYLDTLLEVVLSRRARAHGKTAGADASITLARKISDTQRDRGRTGAGPRSGAKPATRIRPGLTISQALDIADEELERDGWSEGR